MRFIDHFLSLLVAESPFLATKDQTRHVPRKQQRTADQSGSILSGPAPRFLFASASTLQPRPCFYEHL